MVVKLLKIGFVAVVLSIAACNTNGGETTEKAVNVSEVVVKGEILAKQYCATCHPFVDPGILDKNTWMTGVLPGMAAHFGIKEYNGIRYPTNEGLPNTNGVYPQNQTISLEEWGAILAYFAATAPDEAPPQVRSQGFDIELPLFKAQIIASNNVSPIITMVQFLEKGGFYIYDANSSGMARMDAKGGTQMVMSIPNPVSSVTKYKDGYIFANIGSIMPSDSWKGELNYIKDMGTTFSLQKQIRTQVERPVQTKVGDLNGDKAPDILVCGYGNNKGSFYWLDGKTFQKNIIKDISGAINTQIIDFDKDGDLDVFTLFAQGKEQIVYFENDGKGNFKETLVKQFLPVRGSTSFQVIDFNKDGKLDILYTCGDNADYSVIFKAYHGVYIYLGDGAITGFKESYFYPMNGAFKAIASDFDQDGDYDIAAISFFADYVNQPYEGFLYFEQKANLKFKISSHEETYKGRWLTMDVGDVDMDGDDDIIMGNFSQGPTSAPQIIREGWSQGPAAIVLENMLQKK